MLGASLNEARGCAPLAHFSSPHQCGPVVLTVLVSLLGFYNLEIYSDSSLFVESSLSQY